MRLAVTSTLKKLFWILAALSLASATLVLAANLWVLSVTNERIEEDLMLCAPEPVGIVFGTSYRSRGGGANPYYVARLGAAARLFRMDRVDHLLLSGDNRTRYYNEPVTMWRDLREVNVPDADMTLDYAGFSTFDTLVRARKVFGADRVLLITQSWHLPRALFIANSIGLDASGCAVPSRSVDGVWELRMREWLARVAMLGDLYLWQREPHFLGPRVPLPVSNDH